MPEEAEVHELLAPATLQILCHLGLILDALLDIEDEIVFACSV